MSLILPKPAFDKCDETSLSLKWDRLDTSPFQKLALQYKEVHENWEVAKEVAVNLESSEGAVLTEAQAVDLKPGTPYFVRLTAENKNGESFVGPETVFDTQPIDCTPKRKTCIIS